MFLQGISSDVVFTLQLFLRLLLETNTFSCGSDSHFSNSSGFDAVFLTLISDSGRCYTCVLYVRPIFSSPLCFVRLSFGYC